MCPVCQAKVEKLEAANARAVFSDNMDVATDEQADQADDVIESSLLDMITADDSIDEVPKAPDTNIIEQRGGYPTA